MIWYPESSVGADVTDAQYFEDSPWKDFISNSKLSLIDPSKGGSMSLFSRSWKNEKRSKALQTGTIVHSLLLQADNYGVSDIIRPSGKLGDMVYDAFRLRNRENPLSISETLALVIKLHNYYNGKPSASVAKKIITNGWPYYKHLMIYKNNDFILNSEEVGTVLGCLESLKLNDKAMNLLFPKDKNILRFNEFSVYTKVFVKSRPYYIKIKIDNWTLNLKTKEACLNDLKTSGTNLDNFKDGYWETYPTDTDVVKIFHPGSFQKYSYYRQLAMYTKVLESYIIKTYGFKPKIHANIVGVETKDPYRSEVFEFGIYHRDRFSSNQLQYGLEETESLLNLLDSNNYEQNIDWLDPVASAFV